MAPTTEVQSCPDVAGMPLCGVGMWKIPGDQTAATVYEAIKAGYRAIDCACDYGNEKEVGQGIKRALDEGLCKRDELFVTSKLWNTYHRKEHVPLACQRTLDDLGLEYLDLYLIHFPISLPFVAFEQCYPPEWTDKPENQGTMTIDPVPYRETWEAMEKLHAEGKVRRIGTSNITCQMMMDVLSYCKVKPATNQVEVHPYLTQCELVQFCKDNGVGVTALSSFGAISYIPLGMANESENALNDPVIQKIGASHDKTAAQVLLRWAVQRGICVIPKSVKPERLAENLAIFDFELSEAEMKLIFDLNRNRRFNDPGQFTKGMGMKNGYPIYN